MLLSVGSLFVFCFFVGLGTGFDLAIRLNYALLILTTISYLWSLESSKRLSVSVSRDKGPFTVGDNVSITINIRNLSMTPRSWVDAEDVTDIPGLRFRLITSFGSLVAFKNIEITNSVLQRGIYNFGPLIIRSSDPLGLFPREKIYKEKDTIIVYPKVIKIPDFVKRSRYFVGDLSDRGKSHIASEEVCGIRPYHAGDSRNHIHWLTTVRTGSLMVKQLDQGSSDNIWVIFDQNIESNIGDGSKSTDELAATISASVVEFYVNRGLPLGFVSYGSESLETLADYSTFHKENIMRHIATSRPIGKTSLIKIFSKLENKINRNSSVVVITSCTDGTWIDALATLQHIGINVTVILIDRQSFGGLSNTDALVHLLNYGIRTFSVKKDDSIVEALSKPHSFEPIVPMSGPYGFENK